MPCFRTCPGVPRSALGQRAGHAPGADPAPLSPGCSRVPASRRIPAPLPQGAAGSRVSLGGWIPFVRSTCPTPPPPWGAPSPRTKRRLVRPVRPRSRRSLDGGSPLIRRVQPFTGQARPGEKGHAPRGIFSPSHTCGTLNRGLSVLITPQPREGSSVSTDTTSSRVPRGGRRGGERQPNSEKAPLFGRGEVCGLLAFG